MRKWVFSVEITLVMEADEDTNVEVTLGMVDVKDIIEAETPEDAKLEIRNYVNRYVSSLEEFDSILYLQSKVTKLVAEGEEVDYGER